MITPLTCLKQSDLSRTSYTNRLKAPMSHKRMFFSYPWRMLLRLLILLGAALLLASTLDNLYSVHVLVTPQARSSSPCTLLPPDAWIENKVTKDVLAEAVTPRIHRNTVMLTFASTSQTLLLHNWLCSLKAHGVKNYLVIAFDSETRDNVVEFTGDEQSAFFDEALFAGHKVNWDREDDDQEDVWRRLMSFKVTIVSSILEMGYDVFVTDADTSLLQNPFKYLPTVSSCDLEFQPDRKDKFTLAEYRGIKAFNCGVYLAKSSPAVLRLYRVWQNAFNCAEGSREQRALHVTLQQLRQGRDWEVHFPSEEPYERTLRRNQTYDTLRMCYLDPALFPNGGAFFINHDQFVEAHGENIPAVVHTNYMKGRMERKLAYMQASGAWYLNEKGTCSN
eukprot:comp8850_c0_seq1/m.4053 comp8850_c0_seq1/g.4053  ORF comp8850_c0_seq1/g.4053 comp8850_c0_seq1/m.4053 type:complete len:391 (-) comp8850_c0_seq1:552-1724(-)